MAFLSIFFLITYQFISIQIPFCVLNDENNRNVICDINLPEGYSRAYYYNHTDVGGVGRTYIYQYRNGSIFYISNCESLNRKQILRNRLQEEKWIPITGHPFYMIDSCPYQKVDFKGKKGLMHWREIQTREICAGFYHVPCSKLKTFNKALDSISIVPDD